MKTGSIRNPLWIGALCTLLMTAVAVSSGQPSADMPTTQSSSQAIDAPHILTRDETKTILPGAVFFRGQSASTQARNSSGIRYSNGSIVLATLVDTGGYSSSIQESYQAYLLTEVALTIGNQSLAPGAYGFGFLANGQMVVMDIGGHPIFRVPTLRDAVLKRPDPLQILTDSANTGSFRLYLGRSYVTFTKSK